MDDWQLLQDYVERDSEAAFRTLLNRYVNLVYSVALRQVMDAHQAEEVAQAVFILLSRKAGSFRQTIVLSGWLFRTTRFVASRAVRTEQRRQRREQEAFAMQQLTTPDDNWKRISPVLDEALESLGETDRNAVLLRFYNEMSHRETAVALGVSEDAAKKRVSRALDKLRDFIAGRGVPLSVTVLASAVAANAAKAATPEVITSITAKVAASSSAAVGILPPLVSQTLSAWRWAKLKIAGGIGIGSLTAMLLFQWMTASQPEANLSGRLGAAKAGTTSSTVADATPSEPDQATSPSANLDQANIMLFRVLNAQTSRGIAGAKVAVNYVSEAKWWAGDDLVTDDQGMCRVQIPSELSRLDVGVLKDGYVQKFYTWMKDYGDPLPSVYILKVERGVPIGGWVRDENGQAVSDAGIILDFGQRSDSSAREPQPERLGFIRDLVAARTDAQGRWKCVIVPAGCHLLSLEVRHPQFATETVAVRADDQGYVNAQPHLAMKDLWASEAIIVLRPGFQIAGVVLDDSNRPMAGAKVSTFVNTTFPAESTTTASDGRFGFSGIAAGNIELGASAIGFAPTNQTINIQSNLLNLVFRLERGTVVSVRLVDEQGDAVVGAWVGADGPHQYGAEWRATSDTEGWARIEGIPEGDRDRLQFYAEAAGFFGARNRRVDLSAGEPRLRLRRALSVSGRVVDADSSEPISSFKAIPEYASSGSDRSERKWGTNGVFTVTFGEFQPPFRVRVEADGYEPVFSTPIMPEPREQWVELKLKRKDPAKAIRGVVLLPNGLPAVGAEVALITFERGVSLVRGRFEDQGSDAARTNTALAGEFLFDADSNAHTIMAVHPEGVGHTRLHQQDEEVVVQLSPFGTIHGRIRTRDGWWSARRVMLSSSSPLDFSSRETGYSVREAVKSDAEGQFAIISLPGGNYTLHLESRVGNFLTDATPVEVRPGEDTETQIGGTGVTVVGRLEFAGIGKVDWVKQTKMKVVQPKQTPLPVTPTLPGELRLLDRTERERRLDLVESDEWRTWARSQRESVFLKIASDGSFIAEGLRAGEYTLRVELAAEAMQTTGSPTSLMSFLMRPTIASIQKSLMITDAQEQAGETLELGILELQPAAEKNHLEPATRVTR